MAQYKCITKCYYKDRMRRVGEVYDFEDCDCKHFELVGGKKEEVKKDNRKK